MAYSRDSLPRSMRGRSQMLPLEFITGSGARQLVQSRRMRKVGDHSGSSVISASERSTQLSGESGMPTWLCAIIGPKRLRTAVK